MITPNSLSAFSSGAASIGRTGQNPVHPVRDRTALPSGGAPAAGASLPPPPTGGGGGSSATAPPRPLPRGSLLDLSV
jgi:hypothetical protein